MEFQKKSLVKRFLSLALTIALVFSMEGPILGSLFNNVYAAEPEIEDGTIVLSDDTVSNLSLGISAGSISEEQSVSYGESFALDIWGSVPSDNLKFYYIEKANYDNAADPYEAFAAFISSGKGLLARNNTTHEISTILKPGVYYLGYDWESASGYNESLNNNHGLIVNKSVLATPLNLRWNTNDSKYIASWDAVSKASTGTNLVAGTSVNYVVSLTKDGIDVAGYSDILVSDTSYDFTDVILAAINEKTYGNYGFSVKAVPTELTNSLSHISSSCYSESQSAVLSEGMVGVRDENDPVINSYEIQYDESGAGALVATATDNETRVAKYAFSTKTKEQLTDSDWVDATAEQSTFSFNPSSNGKFYFYAADSFGNIATSTEAYYSTKITYHNVYRAGSSTSMDVYLLGNAGYETSPANEARTDYNLTGWYLNESFSGGMVTKILLTSTANTNNLAADGKWSVTEGGAYDIYAKWTEQTLNFNSVSEDIDRYYDGTTSTIGATVDAMDAKVSFEWYKVNEDGSDTLVAEGEKQSNTYTTLGLKDVADSGSYYVIATITKAGQSVTATSPVIDVNIEKKTLTFELQDKTITYSDAAPAQSDYVYNDISSSSQSTGLVDGETLDNIGLVQGTINCAYDPLDTNNSAANPDGYDISATGFDAPNYKININSAKLIVEKKNAADLVNPLEVFFYDGVGTYSKTYTTAYTGEAIEPVISVRDNTYFGASEQTPHLVSDEEYSVSYKDNANVLSGNVEMTIDFSASDNYYGSINTSFTIAKADYDTQISVSYTGRANPTLWVYGENASNIGVTSIKENASVVYYYTNKISGQVTNTMPVDAGEYSVYATLSETDNYKAQTTPSEDFTIAKYEIIFTADSGEFTYNGNAHTVPTYTQTGSFKYGDSIKYISVIGSQTEIGVGENIVNVELSDTTNAENYIITCIPGTITVGKQQVVNPSTFDWGNTPGQVNWIAVSRSGLEVEYRLQLYRVTNNGEDVFTPVGDAVTTSDTSYNFKSLIAADAANYYASDEYLASGKNCGYTVSITTCPSGGSAFNNYSESNESEKLATKYTTLVNVIKGAGVESSTINGEESAVLLQGESAIITTTTQIGYGLGFASYDYSGFEDYIDFGIYNNNMSTYKVTFPAGLDRETAAQAGHVNITVSAVDEYPVIANIAISNTEDLSKVHFSFDASDAGGLVGYAITKSLVAPSESSDEWFNWDQSMPVLLENISLDKDVTAGQYYIHLKDNAGNISTRSAGSIYEISFSNGMGDGEDDSIFSGSMSPVYRVEGSEVTLPENAFTKDGYGFKYWEGSYSVYDEGTSSYVATKAIIENKGKFSIDSNINLSASWTRESYTYTVEYYEMDTNGVYPQTPNESESFKAGYGEVIDYSTSDIQKLNTGMELDPNNNGEEKQITITGNDGVLKLYYARKQFSLTYSVTNIDGSVTKTVENYYYDQELGSEAQKPYLAGYDFVGWSYSIGSRPEKMPNANIEATGSYDAKETQYYVVYHMQNLPESKGAAASTTYELLNSTPEVLTDYHGASVNYAVSENAAQTAGFENANIATAISGFTAKKIVVTQNQPSAATIPDGASDSATAIVDDENKVYINIYYDRNYYNVTLNVWKDSREVSTGGSIIYSSSSDVTWSYPYGTPFSAAELDAYETYNIDHWTDGFSDAEKDGYILADYCDWSSGLRPTTMPAGDVTIAREYVPYSTSEYKVEIYMEKTVKDPVTGAVSANHTYNDNPDQVLTMFGTISDQINIGSLAQQAEANLTPDLSDDIDIAYDQLFLSVPKLTYYQLDESDAVTNVMSGVIPSSSDGILTLKLYFERKSYNAEIRYYLSDETTGSSKALKDTDGKSVNIKVNQKWGTTVDIKPLQYFNNPTVVGESFRDEGYAVSYSGYYYNHIVDECSPSDGSYGSHYPTKTFSTVEDINYDDNAYMLRVGTSGSSYINVIYSQIDKTAHYEVIMTYQQFDSSGADHRNNMTYNLDGIDYQIRVANECDIFQSQYLPGSAWSEEDKAIYPAGYTMSGTYTYLINPGDPEGTRYVRKTTQKSGDCASLVTEGEDLYTPITITTYTDSDQSSAIGTATYYKYDDGDKHILYVVNPSNAFYAGNRASYNYSTIVNGYNYRLGYSGSEGNVVDYYKEEAADNYTQGYIHNPGMYNIVYKKIDENAPEGYTLSNYVYNYSWQGNTEFSVTYSFGGQTKTNTGYKKNDEYIITNAELESMAPKGFHVTWYKEGVAYDSGTKSKITGNATYTGQLERDEVENHAYIIYQLPVSVDLHSGQTTDYLLDSNLNNIDDGEGNVVDWSADDVLIDISLDDQGAKQYMEDPYSYLSEEQKQSGFACVMGYNPQTYTFVNDKGVEQQKTKYALAKYYYIDGVLALIDQVEYCPAANTAQFNYEDYAITGLNYDDTNTNNKLKAYAESPSKPVNLYAYFVREAYTLVVDPANSNISNQTTYPELYGRKVELETPSRQAYDFAGWSYYTWDASLNDGEGGYVPISDEVYASMGETQTLDSENNVVKTTFRMPKLENTDQLYARANWSAGEFNYALRSFFAKEDGSYESEIFNDINLADRLGRTKTVNVNYATDSFDGVAYYKDDEKEELLAVVFEDANTNVKYVFSDIDSTSIGQTSISVTNTNLVGATLPVDLISEELLDEQDYVDTIGADNFEIFEFSKATYQYRTALATMTADGDYDTNTGEATSCYAYYNMNFALYFARLSNLNVRAVTRADDGGVSGALITGVGNHFVGESVTLRAVPDAGYTLIGWYKAEDVLKGYAEDVAAGVFNALGSYEIKDGLDLTTLTALSYDDYTFDIAQSGDYVAMVYPNPFTISGSLSARITGKSSYKYRYRTSDNLSVDVDMSDLDPATAITGYRWYEIAADDVEVDENTGNITITGERVPISGANSATYKFPTGKDTGKYYYQCDILVSRSDNGRSGKITTDVYGVTVSPYSDGNYVSSTSYSALYDGNYHSIKVNFEDFVDESKFDVYYSQDVELDESNYDTEGTTDIEEVSFKDVELLGTTPKVHTIYYYVKSNDPNYLDVTGSADVEIKPVELSVSATSNFYSKIYDGETSVSGDIWTAGSDKYRLSRGENNKKYYNVSGYINDSEAAEYILNFDADYDRAHVETATSLTLKNFEVYDKDSQNVTYNYYVRGSVVLSASIAQYTLYVAWDNETPYTYNGSIQGPEAYLTDSEGNPIDENDLTSPVHTSDLKVTGLQENTGSFTAYVGLKNGADYYVSDFKFGGDSASCAYSIVKCPIEITPVYKEVTYDGNAHKITDFIIEVNGVETSTLPSNQNIVIESDIEKTDVGEYESAIKSVVITAADQKATTSYYDITTNTNTLKIDKCVITANNIKAENKIYDAKTNAKMDVSDVVFENIVPNDASGLALDLSKVSGIFEDDMAGNDKEVYITVTSDALIGSKAHNYYLDVDDLAFQTETTADIYKKEVVVSLADLSAVYGEYPEFELSYSGFVAGDDIASVASGLEDINYKYYKGGNAVIPQEYSYSYQGNTISGMKLDVASYSVEIDYTDKLISSGTRPVIEEIQADNYVFVWSKDNASLEITKRPLYIQARDMYLSKTYDNTAIATDLVSLNSDISAIAASAGTSGGLLQGDSIRFKDGAGDYSALYNSANVDEAYSVTVSNIALDTAFCNNYMLENSTLVIDGEILPKELSAVVQDKSTIYGNQAPAYTVVLSGYVPEEVGAESLDGITYSKELTNGSGVSLISDYDTESVARRDAGEYDIILDHYNESSNYVVTSSTEGKLEVAKRQVYVKADNKSIVYGRDEVPGNAWVYGEEKDNTNWSYSFMDSTATTGFVYDDVANKYSDDGIISYTDPIGYSCYETGTTPVSATTGYKEAGYLISLSGVEGMSADNYTFSPVSGKYMVNKQYISVSGVSAVDKVYDATTHAHLKFVDESENSLLHATCYVSGATESSFNLVDLISAGSDTSGMTDYDIIASNIIIKGEYISAEAGSNIPINLTMSTVPGSFLARNYVLYTDAATQAADMAAYGIVGADECQKQVAANITKIEKRPIEFQALDLTIKYGTSIPSSYTHKSVKVVIQDEDNGFAPGDAQVGVAADTINVFSVSGTSPYYTTTYEYNANGGLDGTYSPVGTYSITPADFANRNYIVSKNSNGVLTVVQNRLETPTVSWSSENAGYATWEEVPHIGNVAVDHYEYTLYKYNESTSDYDALSGYENINNGLERQVNLLEAIRSFGAGSYAVGVKAIASTVNNQGKVNVADSYESTAQSVIKAVNVNVAFNTDNVTNAATAGGKEIYITDDANKITSYVVIEGEDDIPIYANWQNADGKSTGYKIASCTADNDAVTVSNASGANADGSIGKYVGSVSLASGELSDSSDINIRLKLAARAASLDGSIVATGADQAYGYAKSVAPRFDLSVAPKNDNVDESEYTYSYSWSYVRGANKTSVNNNTDDENTSQWIAWDEANNKGFVVYKRSGVVSPYTIKCTVTATRKDNGQSVTKDFSSAMTISLADISDTVVTISDWAYGDARVNPLINPLISELEGHIDYQYYVNGTWTDEVPTDVGNYKVRAVIEETANYEAFTTPALNFKITKVTLDTPTGLTMKSSSKAAYGIAQWDLVDGFEENAGTNSASSVVPTYEVKLYKLDDNNNKTLIKTYEASNVVVDNNGGYASLDMSSEFNEEGRYAYTVKALSDSSNCNDSAVSDFYTMEVSDSVHVKEAGSDVDLVENGQVIHTYNANDLILGVSNNTPGVEYRWLRDGEVIAGANENVYKVRYVEDSGVYSCQLITHEDSVETVYETTYVHVVIVPREIVLASVDATKTYDGNPLSKDGWWIKQSGNEDASDHMSVSYNADDGLKTDTEIATGNVLSNVLVKGSITEATATPADNTIDISNVIIKEGDKVVYNASMLAGGSANYYITTLPGALKVNKAEQNIDISLLVTSFVYDGRAHKLSGAFAYGLGGVNDFDGVGDISYSVNSDTSDEAVSLTNADSKDVQITASATNNYAAKSTSVTLEVLAKNLGNADVYADGISVLDIASQGYSGNEIKPEPIVKYETESGDVLTLTKGVDYDISYADNVDTGIAKVIISGKGNYTGSITKSFEISSAKQFINTDNVVTSFVYDGRAHKLSGAFAYGVGGVSDLAGVGDIVYDFGGLTSDDALSITDVGHKLIGITALATENYDEETTSLTFNVIAKDLGDADDYAQGISVDNIAAKTYTGSEIKPEPVVKYETESGDVLTLVKGIDYELSYADNIHAGSAVITISGKGNYTGSITKNFTIVKKALLISSESDEKVFDYSELSNNSYSQSGLADTDTIVSIDMPSSMTDVFYVNGLVTSVDNEAVVVSITNADPNVGDVTNDYAISYANGKLKVSPRGTEDAQGPFVVTMETDGAVSDTNSFNHVLNNGVITPEIKVYDNRSDLGLENLLLEKGVDYTISGTTSARNVGDYSYTVTMKGNYQGSFVVNWSIVDVEAPVGSITVGSDVWDEFLSSISFGLYKNKATDVKISANDENGGSGIKEIDYFTLFNAQGNELSRTELESLPAQNWTAIENNSTFKISPNDKLVVYARIEDNAGHVTYISSDGIVLDDVKPSLNGVSSGMVYCEEQTINFADETKLKSVKVNDSEIDISSGHYVLAADGTSYTIVACDEAGNETKITNVTIYDGHDFDTENILWMGSQAEMTATFICKHNADHVVTLPCAISENVIKEATKTQKGEIEYTASVDFEGETYTKTWIVDISIIDEETNESESLTTELEIELQAPDTNVSNFNVDLAERVVKTFKNDNNILNNNDIIVYLVVSPANEDEIESNGHKEKALRQLALMGDKMNIGKFIDISMFLKINNLTPERITSLYGEEIGFELKLPNELLNTNPNVERSYTLVRVHDYDNGPEAEVLQSVFDAQKGTLSFKSSLFSTYLIAYRDSEIARSDNAEGGSPWDDSYDAGAGSENADGAGTDNASGETTNNGDKTGMDKSSKDINTKDGAGAPDNEESIYSEIHCHIHWWIVIITLGEVVVLILLKKNDKQKKLRITTLVVGTALDVICVLFGFCLLDLPFAIIGTFIALIVYFLKKKQDSEEDEEEQ